MDMKIWCCEEFRRRVIHESGLIRVRKDHVIAKEEYEDIRNQHQKDNNIKLRAGQVYPFNGEWGDVGTYPFKFCPDCGEPQEQYWE